TVPCVVLVVSLLTSHQKLRNLHDQSHKYVVSKFSSSFWFSTNGLFAMSVAMSLGIAGVYIPLSSIGTMVSRRAESKTLFRVHMGMESVITKSSTEGCQSARCYVTISDQALD
ncbi:hypothetical protein, partial [Klebsiella pneumoniae]|uniref:hypothetical protein n=1 Tax=Klebsiella pneumoniae TaxID=573 RepID=UPI003D368BCF